ncbi:hypothetical protein J437_LFUL005286 [Ladona fulva]|uniref:PiggyBac transposable element-derived protein domain-containing protein n=1 Tax=Ladona fulva TaxID=123851 RepID=A0A8K0K3I1_LADFU|nr:hypothetical protein J437_LFUL005286 [Ladona fulva]
MDLSRKRKSCFKGENKRERGSFGGENTKREWSYFGREMSLLDNSALLLEEQEKLKTLSRDGLVHRLFADFFHPEKVSFALSVPLCYPETFSYGRLGLACLSREVLGTYKQKVTTFTSSSPDVSRVSSSKLKIGIFMTCEDKEWAGNPRVFNTTEDLGMLYPKSHTFRIEIYSDNFIPSDMESDSEWYDVEYSSSGSGTTISEQSSSSESDQETAESSTELEWTRIDADSDVPPPTSAFPFSEESSINSEMQSYTDVLEYFNFFFDDSMVNMIVEQTNLYAEQCIREQAGSSSGVSNWHPTTSDELRIIFSIVMAQSIVVKPQEVLGYISVKRYLHFSDNSNYDPNNHPNQKLNKIWPVYERLNKKFQDAYTPERNVTIDESLMLYKGRLGWIQYIPMKRARFGIKTFMLCESKSGYIWSTIIYTGKGTLVDSDIPEQPVTTQVVTALMKPLLNKGHCVTTDSFYTSPELANLLILQKTDTYGTTLRMNRKGVPPNLKTPKKCSTGQLAAYRRGKVMVMRWKDKKDVTNFGKADESTDLNKFEAYGGIV